MLLSALMTDPIADLSNRLGRAGSYRALALELDVSAGHLHHVLSGKRAPGDKLLKALGYESETRVTYRKTHGH